MSSEDVKGKQGIQNSAKRMIFIVRYLKHIELIKKSRPRTIN